MKVRNLLILLLAFILTAGLTFVVFVGIKSGPNTFKPIAGLVSSVELNGGTAVTLEVSENVETEPGEKAPPASDELIEEAMAMFEKRLDARGFYDITMTRQGENSIRIEMYTDDYEDLSDSGDLTEYICERGVLKFYDEEGNYIIDNAAVEEGSARAVKYDDTTYMLYFRLTEDGEKAFEAAAEEFGRSSMFTIEYDGSELVDRSIKNSIQDGQFAASLGLNRREVTNVANQLNTGMIDARFKAVQARSIMPTMGESVFYWLIVSALAGLGVCIVLMAVLNRGFGLIADLVYWMFGVSLIFALAAVRLKLSPAGIAGMAVGLFAFTAMLFAVVNDVKKNASSMAAKEAIRSAFKKNTMLMIDLNAVMLIAGIVMAIFEKSPMGEFSSAIALSAVLSFIFLFGVLRGMLYLGCGAFPKATPMFFAAKEEK